MKRYWILIITLVFLLSFSIALHNFFNYNENIKIEEGKNYLKINRNVDYGFQVEINLKE